MNSRSIFRTLIVLAALVPARLLPADTLENGFRNPPPQSRPHTWWHWMNGNVTKEGITADLEAMARVGVGGAQIFNVGDDSSCNIPAGPIDYLSPQWLDLVKHAASDADVIWAARVSTKGEQSLADVNADPQRSAGLINYLMRDRHGSPFEHSSMTFFVQAPIFMWREHFRHRIASYNEESGRYRELRPVFYVPGPDRRLVQQGKPGAYEFVAGTAEQYELVVEQTQRSCEQAR